MKIKQEQHDHVRHQSRDKPGKSADQQVTHTNNLNSATPVAPVFAPATDVGAATTSSPTAAGSSQHAVREKPGAVPPAAVIGGDVGDATLLTSSQPGWQPDPAATGATVASNIITVPETAEVVQQLPPGCDLTDCNENIFAAGRQLTKLLRHVKAPDEQVVQLNQCINKLRGPQGSQSMLDAFWYDYSQLQLWVERRNAAQCKSALQQLVSSVID